MESRPIFLNNVLHKSVDRIRRDIPEGLPSSTL